MAGDGAIVCGPGYEYYRLAEQLRGCVPEVEELARRLSAVRAAEWQSPAGAAFTTCLTEHISLLEALRLDIMDAAGTVDRFAADTAARQLAQAAGP